MFGVAEQTEVGAAVRAARRAQGTSLRVLAARLGVSPATLSAVENGRTPLTVARLSSIADLVGVSVEDLVRGADHPERPGRSGEAPGPGGWRDFSSISMDVVLEGAAASFVRRGFHATTMREIAAEADLSVAGVYHHYATKESILVALLDLTMAEIAWRVEDARGEGEQDGPWRSFGLMVESLALFHAARADLAFIGASEMRALGRGQRERITSLRDDVQHALDRQARLCATPAPGAVDDVRTLTRAVATMCTALPSWFRPDGPLDASTVARRYATYAVTLLDAHVSTTP